MTSVTVVVPDDCREGAEFTFQVEGREFRTDVPHGAIPGQSIEVHVPTQWLQPTGKEDLRSQSLSVREGDGAPVCVTLFVSGNFEAWNSFHPLMRALAGLFEEARDLSREAQYAALGAKVPAWVLAQAPPRPRSPGRPRTAPGSAVSRTRPVSPASPLLPLVPLTMPIGTSWSVVRVPVLSNKQNVILPALGTR